MKFMPKYIPKKNYPPIVVVFKRQWSRSKPRIKIFKNLKSVDLILEDIKGKYIPAEADILEVGVGGVFEKDYRKKYKL